MEKISKKHKILFVCLFFVVGALFLTAVIQTFVLKTKQNTLSTLENENSQLKSQLGQTREESDYKVKVDNNGNYVCTKITKDSAGNIISEPVIIKISQNTLDVEWEIDSTNSYYFKISKDDNDQTIYEELYFMASDEYNSDYTQQEGTDENGNPYGNEGDKIIDIK